MVKKKTVDGWGLPTINYELAEDGDTVVKVFCALCQEYYGTRQTGGPYVVGHKGAISSLADKWVSGTTVIKKNNAADHVSKSKLHRQATLALQSQSKASASGENGTSQVFENKQDVSRQTTLPEHIRKINATQRAQLEKKFQLVHHLILKCKPFKDYESFAQFEKNVHGVDIGNTYLTQHAAKFMTTCIAKEIRNDEVTQPLNSGERRYFSLFYDGSSSAKTMDEKEVYVIKTCKNGKPNFQVMSLEEPKNTNAAGLKEALNNSVGKQQFTFDRKDRQVGNGSDGASVNEALFKLEKEHLGEHLIKGWCANHKAELAIHDAFKVSELNSESEQLLNNIYYLFRKANLKWRLFKRQAEFQELRCLKYKRASGTRWVAHQVDSTSSFLRNLPILLGFLKHQIATPYNKTMKNAIPTLQGHLKHASKLEIVIYMAARQDILAYLSPFSQALESEKLLAPEAITAMINAKNTLSRISKFLEDKKSAALYIELLFPTLAKLVWPYIKDSDFNSAPMFRTRRQNDPEECDNDSSGLPNKKQLFHGHYMSTPLDTALSKV